MGKKSRVEKVRENIPTTVDSSLKIPVLQESSHLAPLRQLYCIFRYRSALNRIIGDDDIHCSWIRTILFLSDLDTNTFRGSLVFSLFKDPGT
jgi:hypothetical protein